MKWTKEVKGEGITKLIPYMDNKPKVRIYAILLENVFEKPVLNLSCELDVEYKKDDNITSKHYGKSIIKVVSPSMKIFFLLPVNFNDNHTGVRKINILYQTIAGESISYIYEWKNYDVYEIYKIDDKELYPSKRDRNSSTSYFDIRKN